MNAESKMTRAQQPEADRAASIVRQIDDLEQNTQMLWGPMGERLMAEIGQAIRSSASNEWLVMGDNDALSLTCPNWKPNGGLGRGDAWLELSEIAEDEEDHSWVADAIGIGRSGMGLQLTFRNGLAHTAAIVMADKATAARLLKLGIAQDEARERLFIPIVIDREVLATAFAENDFEAALAPVRAALELASAAKGELDKLVEQVRAKSKAH